MCESIHVELGQLLGEFCCSISLVKTLNRAIAQSGDAELEASMNLAIASLDAACDRLDQAITRLAHEGAQDMKELFARVQRESQAVTS